VLTPQQFHEHEQHRRFFLDHMVVKGKEAASACVRTLESLERMCARNNGQQMKWRPALRDGKEVTDKGASGKGALR
jgi:hypothetical protein